MNNFSNNFSNHSSFVRPTKTSTNINCEPSKHSDRSEHLLGRQPAVIGLSASVILSSVPLSSLFMLHHGDEFIGLLTADNNEIREFIALPICSPRYTVL